MAKRPKLRMTNADYVAIAVSPALIMALVGSLVFFLIEVLYVGQYQARLMYVFALFVFATVLIGRISIEMGADRAALFALPLGIAMFLVLAKFVEHASPYSHLINIGLLGIVWWSTHKLTWDCTLIDDSEDASGEGLMQRVGVDELVVDSEPATAENELLPENADEKRKTTHTPGLWVLYFSLAALPLFGIGQQWIPASETGRRQYAFGLLTVYVAAGLALLVTTSFLGLRRYLRQRRVEMPGPMAATWVVTGGVLIMVVMLLAALIPRPRAEYSISQVPWEIHSPSILASSRTSVGNDGTENNDENARKVTNEETDSNATATREGDNPTTTSDQGEKQTSGQSETKSDEETPSSQSEQGEKAGSDGNKRSDASDSDDEQRSPSEISEPSETAEPSPSDARPAEATEEARPADESNSESTANSYRRPQSLTNWLPTLGLTGIVKIVLYAALALLLGYLAWKNRREIIKAVADILRQLSKLLARLFGGGQAKSTSEADEASEKTGRPPLRAFASFANPFASGQYRSMLPDELVRYTFEAFEAWSREHGHPRSPDQTPLELIRRAIPKQSPLLAEARQLAQLYNEAAYSPGSVSSEAVARLETLWVMLRQMSQTPVESVS